MYGTINQPVIWTTILVIQPYSEWYAAVTALKSKLDASPDDLSLAIQYWSSISGDAGYDVRDGKRAVETFRPCALKSDNGLAELISTFRKLAEDTGEYPRAELFDPPSENAIRFVARESSHPLSADATWILSHINDE